MLLLISSAERLSTHLGWERDKSVDINCEDDVVIKLYPLPPVDWVRFVDGLLELDVILVCRLPKHKSLDRNLKAYFDRACDEQQCHNWQAVKSVQILPGGRALVFFATVEQGADPGFPDRGNDQLQQARCQKGK